jgi:hypothetical protein
MMSDRKRAESYLAASGAVPISVTRRDGVCTIHSGRGGAHVGDVPRCSVEAESFASNAGAVNGPE